MSVMPMEHSSSRLRSWSSISTGASFWGLEPRGERLKGAMESIFFIIINYTSRLIILIETFKEGAWSLTSWCVSP